MKPMTTTTPIRSDTAIPIYSDELILALSWEGEKPIPFNFEEPLRIAVEKAVLELYAEEHPKQKDIGRYTAVSSFQPRKLGSLLEQILYYRHERINHWDYFETARGSWWQNVPLKPISEFHFRKLKAEMRRHFGEPYEKLVQHFLPHFQELAQDYR
jgi:hypothetical protein